MLMKFEVGQIVPQWVGHPEVTQFDLDDAGGMLTVFYNKPTSDEIKRFHAKNFEFRFLVMNDIIEIVAKIGELNWIDASYNPHTSKGLTNYDFTISEPKGYLLMIFFVDGVSGRIEGMRQIGLNHNVSLRLQEAIKEQMAKPFDLHRYFTNIKLLQQRYPTKELVRMANFYHKE